MLEMGPVLPHEPHGDSREVEIINEGSWDVEIFSLDFDKVRSLHFVYQKPPDNAFSELIQSRRPSIFWTATTPLLTFERNRAHGRFAAGTTCRAKTSSDHDVWYA